MVTCEWAWEICSTINISSSTPSPSKLVRRSSHFNWDIPLINGQMFKIAGWIISDSAIDAWKQQA